jgi:hypothetical protein
MALGMSAGMVRRPIVQLPPWIPLAGGLVNLIVLALVGLAILGKFRWQALAEYEKLSQARGERIEVLEADLQRFAAEAAAAHQRYEAQSELLTVRIEALTATVAQLERNESDTMRRNLDLQRQLEASQRRIGEMEAEAVGRRTAAQERRSASQERHSASQERESASHEREGASQERRGASDGRGEETP